MTVELQPGPCLSACPTVTVYAGLRRSQQPAWVAESISGDGGRSGGHTSSSMLGVMTSAVGVARWNPTLAQPTLSQNKNTMWGLEPALPAVGLVSCSFCVALAATTATPAVSSDTRAARTAAADGLRDVMLSIRIDCERRYRQRGGGRQRAARHLPSAWHLPASCGHRAHITTVSTRQ